MQMVDMWRAEDGLHALVPQEWVDLFKSLGFSVTPPDAFPSVEGGA